MFALAWLLLSDQPAYRDLEILVVVAQHGIYSLIGRTMAGTTRAIHSSDPILADLLVRKVGKIGKGSDVIPADILE